MFKRICAVAIAALGLAGCASNGYQEYPNQAYGYGGYGAYPYGTYPTYGGAYYSSAWPWRDDYQHFNQHEFDDFYRHHDDDRFFRPANGVICDRARDVCFDRHGIANHATKDFFGDHAYRDSHNSHGDDRGNLYSPRPGVICDQRSNDCWNGNWPYSQRDVMTRPRYNEKLQSDASPGRDRRVEQRYWANNTHLAPAEQARPNWQPQFWPPAPERKSRKDANLAPLRAKETAKPHADDNQVQPLLRQQRVNPEKQRPSGNAACPPNGCADD
jgi:Fels-1 prophage protein